MRRIKYLTKLGNDEKLISKTQKIYRKVKKTSVKKKKYEIQKKTKSLIMIYKEVSIRL